MNICVATDLSASGAAATDHALKMAEKLGADVRLLHVVHDPLLAPAFTDDVAGDEARAREELQKIADTAKVKCTVQIVRAEDVAAKIVEASKDCDQVFVGSQGKSAFERLRLGSVAVKVMRQSTVPVVCCPHP